MTPGAESTDIDGIPTIFIRIRAFGAGTRVSVVGLLDPRLRDRPGVGWSTEEKRQLTRVYTMIRIVYRLLPDRLTYFPLACHARKHHQCLQKMAKRQQKSFAYHLPNNA